MPRAKKPGGSANRGDLNVKPTLRAPGGGAYGDRKAFEAAASTPGAQAAMGGVGGAGASVGSTGTPSPTPDNADALAMALAQAQQMQAAGGGLSASSGRPNEPITSGLNIGPGVGPEGVAGPLRAQGPNPDDSQWVNRLPMLAILASRPDASSEVRQLYRRVRSRQPADPFNRMA